MASAAMDGTIVLAGAPDLHLGTADAKSRAVQAMQIDMSQDVLDELLECVKSGRAPQILFGKTPTLKFNGKSQDLELSPEKFTNELYQSNDFDEDEWTFAGLVKHSVRVRGGHEVTAGTDAALEKLKNSMASLSQEKEARSSLIDTTSTPLNGKRLSGKNSKLMQHLHKPSLLGNSRSSPSSPSLGAARSPNLLPTPTSAPIADTEAMQHQKALRGPVLHLLAIEPTLQHDLGKKVRCAPSVRHHCGYVLEKVARLDPESKQWKLQDRSYKELDVWKFPYITQGERQKAIDNAVRAFDRMRVSREDPVWQMLLPENERGKGKVLSRLNLHEGPVAGTTPKNATPILKPRGEKAGQAKVTAKKRKKDDGEAKAAEKRQKKELDSDSDKKPLKERKLGAAAGGDGNKLAKQAVKKAQANGEARTPVQKPATQGAKKQETKSAAQKTGKPATTKPAKQVNGGPVRPAYNSRPKNPSPLSSSPPVNASDFEDNHPIHKTLAATPNSRKRTASDADMTSSANITPAKQRKTETVERVTSQAPPQPSSSSIDSTDDDSTSPIPLSYKQTVQLAVKFRKYYEKYAKLHHELSNSEHPPTEQKRDELMKMHYKLKEMKRDIAMGAARA